AATGFATGSADSNRSAWPDARVSATTGRAGTEGAAEGAEPAENDPAVPSCEAGCEAAARSVATTATLRSIAAAATPRTAVTTGAATTDEVAFSATVGVTVSADAAPAAALRVRVRLTAGSAATASTEPLAAALDLVDLLAADLVAATLGCVTDSDAEPAVELSAAALSAA